MQQKGLWNKNYLLLLQGSLVSYFGSILYSVSIGYWVYEQTGSTALMGLLSSIAMFVVMFVSPLAGSIADRSNRKSIICGTDFLRGLLMLGLGYFAYTSQMNVPMVLFVALTSAFCDVFFSPASTTVFADIVMKEELIRAQSISSGARSVLSMIGKSISGALILWLGVPLLILLNGVSYLISALSELFIAIPRNEKEGTPLTLHAVWNDLKQGTAYVLKTSGLNTFVFCAVFMNLTAAGMEALYLPLCYEKGFTVMEYGWLSSVLAAGGLLGVAITGVLKIKPLHQYILMMGGFLLGSVFYIGAYLCTVFWGMSAFFFVGVVSNTLGNAVLNAALILAIPREKRGLIFGFISTFAVGGQALSTILYGFLGEYFPLALLGVCSCLLSTVPALIFARSKTVKQLMIESMSNTEVA